MRISGFLSLVTLSLPLMLVGCDDGSKIKPEQQNGADPMLPEPKNFLLPPMQVPDKIDWKPGETPEVAPGLKIERIAEDLLHPRQVYALPNNDILVVEANGPAKPTTKPKQLITGIIQKSSGKGGKGGDRITLLRNTNGEWQKHVLLQNLHSPFGVQLVGNTLYVANADAILKFPYQSGQTEITEPGVELTELPGGPLNHHWTKALLASPDGSKLYVGVGSNSNVAENGIGAEYRRAAVLEVDTANGASRIYASGIRNPTGL